MLDSNFEGIVESIVNKASDYVTNLFKSHLQQGITYHNLTHTLEVVKSAEEISEKSKLSSDELEMLSIAAWFHDVGIILQYNEHEEKSAELCREFLEKRNYSPEKINRIERIILSTRIQQKPTDILEQIICDADLSHMGKKDFDSRSELLRDEWKNMLDKEFSDSEWLKINIDFLTKNKFHTKMAKILYDDQLKKNLTKLKRKLIVKEF